MRFLEFIGRFGIGYVLFHYIFKEIRELPLKNQIVGYIILFIIIMWILLPYENCLRGGE